MQAAERIVADKEQQLVKLRENPQPASIIKEYSVWRCKGRGGWRGESDCNEEYQERSGDVRVKNMREGRMIGSVVGASLNLIMLQAVSLIDADIHELAGTNS